jgi:hypothetical protein
MDGERLGPPYQDLKQSEVDALVRDGMFLNRLVWIMDGNKVIAECSLVGEFLFQPDLFDSDLKAKKEYGLFLGFKSVEEAQKVGAILRLEPKVDDLIRS